VNKLGWALILVGGGLVVYGARSLVKPATEPDDSDYDETNMTEEEFDAMVRQADLNDGV
jgi:hypothetical protein